MKWKKKEASGTKNEEMNIMCKWNKEPPKEVEKDQPEDPRERPRIVLS